MNKKLNDTMSFPIIEIGGFLAGLILCGLGAMKHMGAPPLEPSDQNRIEANTLAAPTSSLPVTRSASTINHPSRVVRTRSGDNVLFYEGSYALVVGISEYTDPNIPDLPGVRNDVERVSDALKLHGFEVEKVLNPSRDELHLAYTEFINKNGQDPSQKNNRLFFYYAGHGINLPGAGGIEQGFLIGRDAPSFATDERGFRRESYPLRNIHNLAEDILTNHAMFIFDSCFSGALFTQRRAVIPPEIEAKMAKPVRQFITSGSAKQKVPDQSIFCDLLVDSLINGTADSAYSADGYMTGSDLSRHLADEVKKRSSGSQTPQYGKDKRPHLAQGDFVFTLNPSLVKTGSIITQPLAGGSNGSGNSLAQSADVSSGSGRPGLEYENSLGMRFRRLNPSHFKITNAGQQKEDKSIKTGQIEIKDPTWLCQYEVTQENYERIIGDNPSDVKDPLRPIVNVSWIDASNFCKELTEYERRAGTLPDGMEYRLPWEAEWDLAENGSSGVNRTNDFSGDDWWKGVFTKGRVRRAGGGAGNNKGFHDLNENVIEWCGDAFMAEIPTPKQVNPRGPFTSATQLVRGVSSQGASQRIGSFDKYFRAPYIGFRVVLATIEPHVDDDVPRNNDFYQLSQLFHETEYQNSKPTLKKFVLEIAQRRMQIHGYFLGKPDGAMGAKTQSSLNEFQWVNRLEVTGKLGNESIGKLKLVGITNDDVKKGVEVYVKRTSSSTGSNNSNNRVASEITKWRAAGGSGFTPPQGGPGFKPPGGAPTPRGVPRGGVPKMPFRPF